MKAFIITTKGFKPSENNAKKVMKAATKHGLEANIFYGMSANDARFYLVDWKIPMRDYTVLPRFVAKNLLMPGVQGCFLSHFILWNECVKLNEPIVVLEHDGIMVRPLDVDWQDVLQLDPFRHEEDIVDPAGVTSYNQEHNYWPGWFSMRGAYAYAIKPHAAKKLIDAVFREGFLATDDMISSKYVILEQIRPRVAVLDSNYKYSLTNNSQSMQLWGQIK